MDAAADILGSLDKLDYLIFFYTESCGLNLGLLLAYFFLANKHEQAVHELACPWTNDVIKEA